MKNRPKKEKKFSLDEVADYMDKKELGELNLNDIEDIGEYIEDLKIDTFEGEDNE